MNARFDDLFSPAQHRRCLEMEMLTGGIHNVNGEVVHDLLRHENQEEPQAVLEGLIVSCEVDELARVKLFELQAACERGVDVTISFEAVKAEDVPHTFDASSNRQPFTKIGNMYFLCYEGKFQGDSRDLIAVGPGGKVEAMYVWCCLAAS